MSKEFRLDDIVPWGRSAEEYTAFFALERFSPSIRVLDCAAGPSSFAAEMSQRGVRVIAADPLYQFERADIEERIEVARQRMAEGLTRASERFVWSFFGSVAGLIRYRMATMRRFLDDYEEGLRCQRYVTGALPALGFAESSFDIVLCSHFLFMYDHELDVTFHDAAICEMLRVGGEVRIFPLLNLDGQPSRFVEPVSEALRRRGFSPSLEPVAYEFQKGGNMMLRIARPGPRAIDRRPGVGLRRK
jgi:ubiquinone/menaquinone biosynthesis C-methylase UbiE